MINKFLFALVAFFLISCKTQEVVSEKSETFKFIEREVKDTILKGFEVRTELSLPQFTELRIYDTIKVRDKSGDGLLLLFKDKYGKLQAECSGKDKELQKLRERVTETSKSESTTIIKEDPRTWYEKLLDFIPWYGYLLAGFALGLILRLRIL